MLVNLKEVIEYGRKIGSAVGAINTPNLETMLAALEAAEELCVPLIIAHAQLHESIISVDVIGPIMLDMARKAKIPVCVHLDHGETYEMCVRAIDIGFTSVMIDASTLIYEENIKITKKVVDYAHLHNASVEAELGQLPNRESGDSNDNSTSLYTNPALVPDFVSRTGVDALAIAFGTAHGIYKVKPVLNIDIIKEIRKLSDIPLVMHGGSGLQREEYREAIKAGIDKINYYTYMSYDGFAAAKKFIEKHGTGFFHDICVVATQAEKNNLKKILTIFANR